MLLSSHTFRISHDIPTLFAMVTNLRITQYPLFLTHNISKKLISQLFTHRPIQVTHNLTLASHSSSTPFSAISSLFLSSKAKGRKTHVNFTNSKLLANHIYLWYNNTNSTKKQNIVNSLVRWKHTLLDFCFQKTLSRDDNLLHNL